jgi:hypothetical protein
MVPRGFIAMIAVLAFWHADAALLTRGANMVYDDATNLTWLRGANFAAGSTYDDGFSSTDGRLTHASALAWAARGWV